MILIAKIYNSVAELIGNIPSHSAQSKKVFVAGAVKAAKFIVGKPIVLYDMGSILKLG